MRNHFISYSLVCFIFSMCVIVSCHKSDSINDDWTDQVIGSYTGQSRHLPDNIYLGNSSNVDLNSYKKYLQEASGTAFITKVTGNTININVQSPAFTAPGEIKHVYVEPPVNSYYKLFLNGYRIGTIDLKKGSLEIKYHSTEKSKLEKCPECTEYIFSDCILGDDDNLTCDFYTNYSLLFTGSR